MNEQAEISAETGTPGEHREPRVTASPTKSPTVCSEDVLSLTAKLEGARSWALWTDCEANQLVSALGWERCGESPTAGVALAYKALNGSVDAALTLAERVMPGWWLEIKTRHAADEHPSMKWSAEFEWPEPVIIQAYGETLSSRESYHSFASTPGLAICAAILRASPMR